MYDLPGAHAEADAGRDAMSQEPDAASAASAGADTPGAAMSADAQG